MECRPCCCVGGTVQSQRASGSACTTSGAGAEKEHQRKRASLSTGGTQSWHCASQCGPPFSASPPSPTLSHRPQQPTPVHSRSIHAMHPSCPPACRRLAWGLGPGPRYHLVLTQPSGEQMETALSMLAAGRLRPVIDRALPLEQARWGRCSVRPSLQQQPPPLVTEAPPANHSYPHT